MPRSLGSAAIDFSSAPSRRLGPRRRLSCRSGVPQLEPLQLGGYPPYLLYFSFVGVISEGCNGHSNRARLLLLASRGWLGGKWLESKAVCARVSRRCQVSGDAVCSSLLFLNLSPPCFEVLWRDNLTIKPLRKTLTTEALFGSNRDRATCPVISGTNLTRSGMDRYLQQRGVALEQQKRGRKLPTWSCRKAFSSRVLASSCSYKRLSAKASTTSACVAVCRP